MSSKYLVRLVLVTVFCFSGFGQSPNTRPFIEIPFDFIHNQIVVKVNIAGKGPFSMLLDTGTDPSAIDLATAKEIGLKLTSAGQQGSGGGMDKNLAFGTRLPLVEIGTLAARNVDAAAIDLSRIGERMETPVHGVLGQSLLKGRIVQIDYPGRVARFFESTPFPKPGGRSNTPNLTTLTFRYENNVLIDGVLVNGKPVTANFDTGSSGAFALSPAAVTALGLDPEVVDAKVQSSVGYNGKFENREGKLKNVSLGGISIDSPAVTFFGKGTGYDKKPWGINIGNGFLKDYVVTIDYRSKTITLVKP